MAWDTEDLLRVRDLLRVYNETPDKRAEITAQIEDRYRQTIGILVLDCSGFTRAVRRAGIVHFLALLERLEETILPIVDTNGGSLLRTSADNIFVRFGTAMDAVLCARDILRNTERINEWLPDQEDVYVSIGVGYGPVLVMGKEAYDDQMNLAYLLGEELATRGEVLLTPEARTALGTTPLTLVERSYVVTGIPINAFRLE